MKIPNISAIRYQKSLNKTNKVLRTITPNKKYVPKSVRQAEEIEQKYLESLQKQKQLEKELFDTINNLIECQKAEQISYYTLLLYGIKLNKEDIMKILKARKAN